MISTVQLILDRWFFGNALQLLVAFSIPPPKTQRSYGTLLFHENNRTKRCYEIRSRPSNSILYVYDCWIRRRNLHVIGILCGEPNFSFVWRKFEHKQFVARRILHWGNFFYHCIPSLVEKRVFCSRLTKPREIDITGQEISKPWICCAFNNLRRHWIPLYEILASFRYSVNS